MSSEIVNVLDEYRDRIITIKLRNKKTIQGTLKDFDQRMNLILTDSKDITENNLKNLDKMLLHGSNILIISLPHAND